MQPFEEVVAEHGAVVLRVCRALVGPADADDAWSETFLAALRAYPDLRPDSNVRAWLVTIAHRKAIDQLRGASRRATPDAGRPRRRRAPTPGSSPPTPTCWRRSTPCRPSSGPRSPTTTSPASPTPRSARSSRRSEAAARRSAADGIASLRKTYGEERSDDHRDDHHPAPTTSSASSASDALGRARPPACTPASSSGPAPKGLLDVAYRTVDTPYGSLLLAATPQGLVRVAFEGEGHDAVLAEPGRRGQPADPAVGPRHRRRRPPARRVLRPPPPRASTCRVDLRLAHGFRRDVLDAPPATSPTARPRATPRWPRRPGTRRRCGPSAGRARHNPVPIIVPCHRVVRSDGTIGQYLGGTEMKAALLAMEAA